MIIDPLQLPGPELTDDRREALWTALHAEIDAGTYAAESAREGDLAGEGRQHRRSRSGP